MVPEALQIVCAVAQLAAQCAAAQPNAVRPVGIEVTATVPGVAGAAASFNPFSRVIHLRPMPDDQLASYLAHELTHVVQVDAGVRYGPFTCFAMEYEAFTAQRVAWAAAHDGAPAFTSPPAWAAINAVDDCRKSFGIAAAVPDAEVRRG
jgi:hypothetical protein